MSEDVKPIVSVKKAPANARCCREVYRAPSGNPVYCPKNATLIIDGTPLCPDHARESMAVLALTRR